MPQALVKANTASNVGGATEVFKQKTVADLEDRTLTTTTPNVVLTQNASTVAIDAGITDTTTVSSHWSSYRHASQKQVGLGDTSGGAVISHSPHSRHLMITHNFQ